MTTGFVKMAVASAAALTMLPAANAQTIPGPLKVLQQIFTPTPVEFPQEEYDGLEFRYGRIIFRPAMFKTEGVLLAFVLLYVGVYFFTGWYNKSQAEKWVQAHEPLLESQFSKPAGTSFLLSDGAADMFMFSTGRRNVQSLHTVFTFLPRHDLFQLILAYGWTLYDLRYTPEHDLTLDFKLGTAGSAPAGVGPNFVWAIVEKDELKNLKTSRWDLGITRAGDNAKVPKSCVVMSEIPDVTETLLNNSSFAPIVTLLKDPKLIKHFKSLSVTDLPLFRPAGPIRPDQRERHVILSLKVPSSASEMADTVPLVKAVFGMIDALEGGKIHLRPETSRKLKTAREELEKDLIKEATEEKVKEAEESKRTAKRRAEEERLSKLSAEQQRKALEKEKKKSIRKGTTKVRMG